MNLYFRFLFLLLKRAIRPLEQDAFSTCVTGFRVNLSDLDINLHMNNGRYLSIMDLGRLDLMLRGKIFWSLFLRGYYPVVVSESIRFKKSLEPFQKFTVETSIEAWDEKDFFMLQSFRRGDELVAEGYLKARFRQRGRKSSVPTAEVFGMAGKSFDAAKLSARASAQGSIEKLLG